MKEFLIALIVVAVAALVSLFLKKMDDTSFSRLVDKLLSGRFIVTVMMSLTYCYLVSFIITKMSDKVSGDFALGFVSGFSTSFMLIIQWYFDDKKETFTNGGNYEKTVIDTTKSIVVASPAPSRPTDSAQNSGEVK